MWKSGIVGFGSYHYKYESGREGDAPLVAFASRASNIALYIILEPKEREYYLAKFGKHKTAVSCIYIKTLEDINLDVFGKMINCSVENNRSKFPS